MYSASNAFHNAVKNDAHQIALLIFDDAVFTNDDIVVTNGIEFNDYFNTDENLSIGQALSNEISFSIFNDPRLLNNYTFGDFTATIGAQIGGVQYDSVPEAGRCGDQCPAGEQSCQHPDLRRDCVLRSCERHSPGVQGLQRFDSERKHEQLHEGTTPEVGRERDCVQCRDEDPEDLAGHKPADV